MTHTVVAARGLTLLAFLAALAGVAPDATAAPPPDTDHYVAQAMQAFGVPGMSVAIVEGGKTTLARGYGVRDIRTGAPADEHTAFPIGSETKAFTAACLAILVDQHKLSWDDRVVDKLPGFQMYDPYATAHMTVRDLLTHRSGLGLGEGDLLFLPATNRSRADMLHALRYLKPATGFRESFAYDNILYVVAGLLIEAVSGQSWESFVTEHVLKPAGMRDAHPSYDATASNAVALHARTAGQIRGVGAQGVLARGLDAPTTAPAGGINASAADLAQWMRLQLAHGQTADGTRIFSAQQAAQMWTPVVVVPGTELKLPAGLEAMQPALEDYALGWFVETYHGHLLVEHAGGVLGGVSMLYLIPDADVGLAVDINSEDAGARRAVMFHLLDHYLGLPPADWIAIIRHAQDASVAKASALLKAKPATPTANTGAPSLASADYAGTYLDPWYGEMTVSAPQNGKLHIRFDRSPGMEGELSVVSGNVFRTAWTDPTIENAYVTFNVAGGKVGGVKLAAVSPLADFSWDYQDLAFRPEGK